MYFRGLGYKAFKVLRAVILYTLTLYAAFFIMSSKNAIILPGTNIYVAFLIILRYNAHEVINMGIGDRIKLLRREKEITQEELAKVTGLSRVTLGFYERNENAPTTDALCAIAQYFGVTTDYLLGLVDNPSRNIEDAAATEIYGLDENALKILRIMKSCPPLNYIPQINVLFAADPEFMNLLRAIRDYQTEMYNREHHLNESDIKFRPELATYINMPMRDTINNLCNDKQALTAIAESFTHSLEADEASDRSMIYLFKAQQLLLSIIEGSVKEPD